MASSIGQLGECQSSFLAPKRRLSAEHLADRYGTPTCGDHECQFRSIVIGVDVIAQSAISADVTGIYPLIVAILEVFEHLASLHTHGVIYARPGRRETARVAQFYLQGAAVIMIEAG